MKDIVELANKAEEVLTNLGIDFGPSIAYVVDDGNNNRWGRCTKLRDGYYVISISKKLMRDEVPWTAAMNTMIHELLHAHEDRMKHTGEWKRCAEFINKVYPQYNIKRCTSYEEKGLKSSQRRSRTEKIKYEIACDGCGHIDRYSRKSKVVKLIMDNPKNSHCRCTLCNSKSFSIKVLDN